MNTARDISMPPGAHLDEVLFAGKPSQLINLPAFIKASLIFGFLGWVSSLGLHWVLVAIPACLLLLFLAVRWLDTHFTEFTIDAERITLRTGILSKAINSLEIFRIQDVTSFHPWWLRPFGLGTVVLATTDSNNPRWYLRGMQRPEQLRVQLNRAALDLRDLKGIREVNMAHV